MAAIKVYSFPLSFAAQKALLALEEKEIAYKVENVNILTGKNLKAEYLKLNPLATIPTIQYEDGTLITDSNVFIKHLDSQGSRLGGANLDVETLQYWEKRLPEFDDNLYTFAIQGVGAVKTICGFKIKVAKAELEKHPELAEAYNQKIVAMEAAITDCVDEQKIAAEVAIIKDICDVAEKQLAQTKFLAGPEFSMADVAMMTFLARLDMLKKIKEFVELKEHLFKYWNECKTRPSYHKVVGPTLGLKGHHIVLHTMLAIAGRTLIRAY